MSRFLFSTLGSLGDLHPYIAVSRALIERGHGATIAAAAEYRLSVESAGVGFAPVKPDMADFGDYRELVEKLFHVRSGPEYLIRRLIMPHLRSTYEQLMDASDGVDLLVSHPLTFTLPLVAEKRGLPWVSTVLSPMSFMSTFDPPVIGAAPWLRNIRLLGETPYRLLFELIKRTAWSWEAPLRGFRAELGLPPLKRMAMFEGQFSPLGTLALFDPQLAEPQADWARNTVVYGSALFDGGIQDDSVLDDLEAFLSKGEKPIVFALGSSAVWIAGDFWNHAATAAERLGRRAILITGPDMPKELPEGVKAFSYLPYSKVFPRAAAIVHQAGIGTLSQSMRSGVPQLIVPVAFDQHDNAHRAGKLGLGRVLPFRKVTAQRLASELEVLLGNDSHATAARRLADELSGINGAVIAAEELIRLVSK